MKTNIALIVYTAAGCLLMLAGCKKEKLTTELDVNQNWSFSENFQTWGLDDNASGTIILKISNGHYECSTSLPFGRREGTIETNNSLINFANTLFFVVPAIYGPSYALDGEYQYEFFGDQLKIRKKLYTDNDSGVEYDLKLAD